MEKEEEKKGEVKEKKPKARNVLGGKIIGVMQGLLANGIVETNSTVLKDKLKTKSRAVIRKAMKDLAKEGKVVIREEPRGKRKQYIYKLA